MADGTDPTGPVRFGSGPALALGVEEELLLVGGENLALAHDAVAVLGALRLPEGAGSVQPDTYAAEVELITPVCADAAEAAGHLARLRAAVRETGATLLGGGIHPAAPFGEAPHHPDQRYAAIASMVRGLLRRTPTCAVHVHVGMPDAETAVRAFNGLRAHLPLLQALSANSPFWHGIDSGLASARAQLFRGYPSGELPRAFSSFDDWASTVEAICAQGHAPDYTFLWWDVRLHPRLGTLEVRAMDAQAGLGSTIGLAALVHGLARHHAEHGPPEDVPVREALLEASFAAARDGMVARLGGRPVAEVAADAIALARSGGAGPALEEAERLVRDGGGAARRRAAFARGGMLEVLRDLVAETAA